MVKQKENDEELNKKEDNIMFKRNLKKAITLALTASMMVGAAAGCGKNDGSVTPTPVPTSSANSSTDGTSGTDNNGNQGTTGSTETPELVVESFGDGEYVYKDSVALLATNWNPHSYESSDDSYPLDFITVGLYSFIFNDELNPVEGKDPYAGYTIVPEMAAAMPVDVTEKVKAEHPEFGIPESATEGFAYVIDLNPLATWEDGTPINADTYVYSMKQLLDPDLKNYRSTDYMDSDFVIANAKNYFYQGSTSYMDNGTNNAHKKSDLVLGEDGVYTTSDGNKMYIGIDFALSWTSGYTLKTYVDAYGDAYFDVTNWETLVGMMDEQGLVPLTEENYTLFLPVITGNPNWGETEDDAYNYLVEEKSFAADYDFANVGIMKTGDYQITLVLGKALKGFTLLYNLSGNWLVYEPYYEACKSQLEGSGAWVCTYNSSVDTTMSYGPYKLVSYQTDKAMRFEKNENWYGYTDNKHIYKDPEDGLIYPMYQTTAIDCQVVAESATNKLMFLKGQLMGYGLGSEDFTEYRNSDYCYATPKTTTFFLVLNGFMKAIEEREAAADFDTTKVDLQTMTLNSFRRAIAVTYDKEAFASTVSPSRSGGYGIIGSTYIYDPDTGAKYRDTDQAKQALCDFYSVDVSKYASLDDAVDSITGYDPVKAAELFTQAYNEALELGYITDADGDGKSDQTVKVTYSASVVNDFMNTTIDYLNKKVAEVTVGTPFEGKIVFELSAPLGDDWNTQLKNGITDTALCGWSGSALNPFSLSDLYVNASRSYDANWFDATTVSFTMTIDGEDVTMNLKEWSDALNGSTIEKNGKAYNFGEGMVDIEIRLSILAKIEAAILSTYNYIPVLEDASMALLSQQVYYVVEEYNPVMGRGGIAYMKYNYDETAWTEYVNSQPNGQLSY